VKAEGGSIEQRMVAASPTSVPSISSQPLSSASLAGAIRVPMSVTVQSLSSKSAVGSLPSLARGPDSPKTTFVFSSAKKYRMVLNIDFSPYAAHLSSDGVFHGMLDLRVRLGPGAPGSSTTSKSKKGNSTPNSNNGNGNNVNNTAVASPPASSSSPGMLLCHVETLIEQPHDSKEPDAAELRQLLHVNDFSGATIRVIGRRLCIITRIWPCLFSSSKRRTRHEEYDSVEYEYTLRSLPRGSSLSTTIAPPLISSSTCHVCIVPKSSYYKWKQKKGKSRGVISSGTGAAKKSATGARRRRKGSSDDDDDDDDDMDHGHDGAEYHDMQSPSAALHDNNQMNGNGNGSIDDATVSPLASMSGADEAAAATIAALPHGDGTSSGSHRSEPSIPFALTTRATARRAAAAAALGKAHDEAAAAAAAATSPRSVSSSAATMSKKKRRRATAATTNGGVYDSHPPISPAGGSGGNGVQWASPRSMSSSSSSLIHHGEFADRPDAEDDSVGDNATPTSAAAAAATPSTTPVSSSSTNPPLVHQQGNAVNVVAWPPAANNNDVASKRMRIAAASSLVPMASPAVAAGNNAAANGAATQLTAANANANALANSVMTLTVPYDNGNGQQQHGQATTVATPGGMMMPTAIPSITAPFDPAMVAQWAAMMGMQLPFAPNNGLSPMLQLQPVDGPFA
jgi:hypothetical protein